MNSDMLLKEANERRFQQGSAQIKLEEEIKG